MQTKTGKKREQENTSLPKAIHEPTQGGTAQLKDNRPSTIYQRKLRETMNTSAASESLSIQRKAPKGSARFQQIATDMGTKYGVDTSGLEATHNSPFPEKLNAEATIQGNKIDFGPGMDTPDTIKHEVSHFIDNTINGTPKADAVVNGQKVDTTREKVVDRMVREPIIQRKEKVVQPQLQNGPATYQLYAMDPSKQEKNVLDGLLTYGILDFIGRESREPQTYVDSNFADLSKANKELRPIRYLGGGAQKVAYAIDNNWVLLTHRQRQNIEDELTLLMDIGKYARIPNLMKTKTSKIVSSKNPLDVDDFIITIGVKEQDFKSDSKMRQIEARTRQLLEMAEKVSGGMDDPRLEQSISKYVTKGIHSSTIRPSGEEKELETRAYSRDIKMFLGQHSPGSNYWQQGDERSGFIQQKIVGTELGKSAADNMTFHNTVIQQSTILKAQSKQDLVGVKNAINKRGVWGDFALFHETATGMIYVFDPDDSVSNGSRNPLQIVQNMIDAL